jgi:hypothetical protein
MKRLTTILAITLATHASPGLLDAQLPEDSDVTASQARDSAQIAEDSRRAAIEFLKDPQKRLRLEWGDAFLEASNARYLDGELRFDYAWDTADPSRIRDGLTAVPFGEVQAIYRRRAERGKGALIGGLVGLATGVLVNVTGESSIGESLPVILGYSTVAALIGFIRAKPNKWERVYP